MTLNKAGKGSIKTRFLMLAIIIIIANSVLGIYVIKTQVENILLSERSKTLEGITNILAVKLKEIYTQYTITQGITDIYSITTPQQEALFEEISTTIKPYVKAIISSFPNIGISISAKNGVPILDIKPPVGGEPDFTFTTIKDIQINGIPIFKVVVWEDKSSIRQYTSQISSKLINAIGVLLLLSIMLTLAIVSQMTKDIEKLVEDIEEIAQSPKHKIDTALPKELSIIAHTVNDISERLWKNTELLKDIIEASPMALILLDKDGKIRYKHQASEEVFGLFPLSQWLEILMPNIQPYITHKEYHVLKRIRFGDRIFNIHVIPVRDGTLLALEDITAISKMEEEIRQKERLVALGTLSAGIAHEVRNPLTAIKGFAQMIEKNPTSPKNQKYINFIIREVSKLETLVREILDFAKEKKPVKQIVPLPQIIEHISNIITDVNISTENFDIHICADPNLLSSVLLNIIKNAAEAGAQNVKIVGNQTKEYAEIHIINDGPPIPEDILPHIFEPFSTKKSKGTGLGLAISHNIITSHGGIITAYNDLKGVVFTIKLPNDCGENNGKEQ